MFVASWQDKILRICLDPFTVQKRKEDYCDGLIADNTGICVIANPEFSAPRIVLASRGRKREGRRVHRQGCVTSSGGERRDNLDEFVVTFFPRIQYWWRELSCMGIPVRNPRYTVSCAPHRSHTDFAMPINVC